ncbi:CRP/FNR family transcriptional regulator, cyclic AMP receptor protein [Alteromonadaceae bacterium Bs31]|nr:CRP/FNR family transcriptional regulator, cyclic AMP receptor protein [Alteromonadaceae bacterium Bs31]
MLEAVSLFKEVPPHYLAELEKLSVTRKYPKNTILVTEGDDSSHLYIIRQGKVSVYLSDDEGRQVILNYMQEGEYFGELSLMDGKPRSASVMTVVPCEMTVISRSSFQDLLNNNHDFALVMNRELARRVRELTESVRDLALLDVYGRVSHTLEKLADEQMRINNPKVTHQDIANMVGSSREMVSRIMKQLIIGEYIEQQSNFIEIKKKLPRCW